MPASGCVASVAGAPMRRRIALALVVALTLALTAPAAAAGTATWLSASGAAVGLALRSPPFIVVRFRSAFAVTRQPAGGLCLSATRGGFQPPVCRAGLRGAGLCSRHRRRMHVTDGEPAVASRISFEDTVAVHPWAVQKAPRRRRPHGLSVGVDPSVPPPPPPPPAAPPPLAVRGVALGVEEAW